MPRTGTRPTTDRVRESLFNVLTARMELTGASVLDLYAGSGALGLEALSRGAASVLFVESDQRAAAVIAQNIEALGAQGATLRRGTVAAVLAAGSDRPVDLVLADPPYDVDAGGGRRDAGRTGHRRVGDARVRSSSSSARTSSRPLTWPEGWSAWPDAPLWRHPSGDGADLGG